MNNPDTWYVDKTGGAGSADAEAMFQNVARVLADGVSAIVVSGPGGETGRVTEFALAAVEGAKAGEDDGGIFGDITERLVAHAAEIGSDYPEAESIAINTAIEMRRGLRDGRGAGWVAMGPERYQARIYELLLGKAGVSDVELVNPTQSIRRDRQGAIDLPVSVRLLSRRLGNPNAVYVMPGTPGVDEHLQTVPVTPAVRGFSDPAGLVVAAALQEARGGHVVYRNIKGAKIPGILRMPPGLGVKPEVTPQLSVVEAGVLGAGGNSIVHTTVLDLLQQTGNVSLEVCSGIPGEVGTKVLRDREIGSTETIAGLALQQVVALIVSDLQMEHRKGVVAGIAKAFSDHDVPLSDLETGYGTVAAYVAKSDYEQQGAQVATRLLSDQYGDAFRVHGVSNDENDEELTVITLVGEAMAISGLLRADVQRDAVRAASNLGIDPRFWPSPHGNAVYLEVPTARANDVAAAVYGQHFGG